jgi:hypothetical protein
MKEKPLLLIYLLVFCCLLGGCWVLRSTVGRPGAMMNVPWKELVADPSQYHGKMVCTEGIYLQGFEVSALGAETQNRDGLIYLVEPAIWIEGAEIISRSNCVIQSDNLGTQKTEFCQVTVCGWFEHCRKCGHLDDYEYQLLYTDLSNPTSIKLANSTY